MNAREAVARAIAETNGYNLDWWDDPKSMRLRSRCERLADAALAAIPISDEVVEKAALAALRVLNPNVGDRAITQLDLWTARAALEAALAVWRKG